MITPLTSSFTVAASATALVAFQPSQLSDIVDSLRLYVQSTEDLAAPPLSLTVSMFALNGRPANATEAQSGVPILASVAVPAQTVGGRTSNLSYISVVLPMAFRVDPAARFFALVVTAPAGPDWAGLAVIDVFRRELRAED